MNFLLSLLVRAILPTAVKIVVNFGIDELEGKFPSLIPIVNACLSAVQGIEPRPELHQAADHFNELISK